MKQEQSDKFTQLQDIVWKTASVIIVLGSFFVGARLWDTGDAVVSGVLVACALAGVWLTRKWVRTSLDDDAIRNYFRLKR